MEPVVYQLLESFSFAKKPADEIFDRINPSKLNDFLKEFMDDLSAKVFRTYNASVTLQKELEGKEAEILIKESDAVEAKVKYYNDCNRKVAILYNHQKSVDKNHEEQMIKINEMLSAKRTKLKMLEDLRKSFKTGKELRGDLKKFAEEAGTPKTLEQCQQKIAKLKTSLEGEENRAKNKEDNKAVALGTSKINYMDPRITIAWCKRKEVPIEKIFPKTLRSKFAWAMNCDPKWQF